MKYCTIVWQTLALLLPGDQDCARKLKQLRPMLLSSHFADPPVEEEEMTGSSGLIECFGGPYLQLRGYIEIYLAMKVMLIMWFINRAT